MFALHLSKVPDDDGSEITFGEYNPDYVRDKQIVWEKNYDADRWLVKTTKMKYGDTELTLHSQLTEI